MPFDPSQSYGTISDTSPVLYVQGGTIYKSTDFSSVADPTSYIFTTNGSGSSNPGITPNFVSPWTSSPWVWSNIEPRLVLVESDQGSDLKVWDFDVQAGVLTGRTRTDADGTGVNWIAVTRGATTAISNIGLGNATNNPSFNWLGTGQMNFVGGATMTSGGTFTAGKVAVNSSAVPANGINLPAANTLGFNTNTAACASFDASGNFITLKATADKSYSLQTPTTGFSITIANNITTLILKPAGTLATGTITMPATPIDGQNVRFTTSQIITSLTVSPNGGQSIVGAPTTLALAQGAAFIYSLSDTTWYRMYLGN